MNYINYYISIKTLSSNGVVTIENNALEEIVGVLNGLNVDFKTDKVDDKHTNIYLML